MSGGRRVYQIQMWRLSRGRNLGGLSSGVSSGKGQGDLAAALCCTCTRVRTHTHAQQDKRDSGACRFLRDPISWEFYGSEEQIPNWTPNCNLNLEFGFIKSGLKFPYVSHNILNEPRRND